MKDHYRIGIVKYMDHASLNRIEKGIKEGLDELGAKYGVKMDYEGLVFDGKADTELMKEIGERLAKEKVDLVVSIATPPTVAMKKVLEENRVKMLFRAVSDPISSKVVDSFERPGEYITGTSDLLDGRELCDVMLKVMPDIKKAGLLYNRSEFSSMMPIKDAKEYLTEKGIEWIEETPASGDEVADAAKRLIEKGAQAVITPTDNTIMGEELEISPIFTRAGVPQFTGSHAFTINGAFMGLGSSYRDSDVRFISLAEDLLIREKSPMDMPVVKDKHSFAAINNQVCESLGYDKEGIKERISELGKLTLFLDTNEEFDENSDY